jgi:Rrf2 family protein
MIFSNSCKYAIRAVLYLATNADESNKLKVDDLAETLDIPKHFLAKILQQLTKHQIISSTKGRNGGFYLTKKNKATSLSTLIEAIDGPVKMRDCILGLENCSDIKPCPYHFAVSDFKSKFYKQLKNESIELCANRIDQSKLTLKN